MSEAAGTHVLHVDDDPDLAEVAADMLEREDGQLVVETATNAEEGLDVLASADVDCVVSDYDMPGRDGIEFLEAVRERHPELPFILYTGKGSEEIASEAISAGVTDYLQKGSGTSQYTVLANRIQNAVKQTRAHRERQRNERRFEAVFEDPQMLVAVLDSEGVLQNINRTAMEFVDAAEETVLDTPFWETPWWDETMQTDVREWVEHAAAGEYVEYDADLTRPTGEAYSVTGTIRPVTDETGEVVSLIVSAREVTGQKERKRRLETLIDSLPGIVYQARNEQGWPMESVRGEVEELTGYRPSQLETGEVVYGEEIIHPDDREEVWTAIQDALDSGAAFELTYRIITSDGATKWVWERGQGIYADGDVELLEGFITDITERVHYEQTIEELHSTARAFMQAESAEEVSAMAVDVVHDSLELPANGVHLYDDSEEGLVPVEWTDRTEEVVGEPPTFTPGEGLAWKAYETGEAQIYDDISTVPERYNADTPVRSQLILPLGDHGVVVIGSPEPNAFDVTDVSLARTLATHATTALDRIEYEQTLREYETLVETVGDPMYVLDENGYIEMANQAFLTYLAADRAEVVGAHASDFMVDGDFERGTEIMQTLLRDPDREWATYEITAVTTAGERIPAEINLTPLTDDSGDFTASVGVVRDITDRKQRERELETLREQMMFALETTNSRIWAFDLATDDANFYGSIEPVFGELNIESADDFFEKAVHPDDRKRVTQTYEAVSRGESDVLSVEFRTHPDIGDIRWMEAEGYLKTENGTRSIIGLTTDVTDRKEREKELERQNERLERFTSVVSHDLRNPLQVASTRLELARTECDSTHLDSAVSALNRMETLIDDLLVIARDGKQVEDTTPVLLSEMVRGCWESVETADATLVCETDQRIEADPSRLKQLLENLIRNAVDHGGADVTVSVGETDDGFYIADDGPGIPEDERERLFDAGYSTTEEGTGFGLSIVTEIADAHDWEIAVVDSDTGGARFEITGVSGVDG